MGVGFLVLQILVGYRNLVQGFRKNVPAVSLKLAYFIIALIYNITEASFKIMHPIWITFLFAIIAVPKAWPPKNQATELPVADLARKNKPIDQDSAMRDFVMHFNARKTTS